MIDELEGSRGAMDAAVHVTIKIQESHFLVLAAVWSLHLWAAGYTQRRCVKLKNSHKDALKSLKSFIWTLSKYKL